MGSLILEMIIRNLSDVYHGNFRDFQSFESMIKTINILFSFLKKSICFRKILLKKKNFFWKHVGNNSILLILKIKMEEVSDASRRHLRDFKFSEIYYYHLWVIILKQTEVSLLMYKNLQLNCKISSYVYRILTNFQIFQDLELDIHQRRWHLLTCT